MLPYMADIRILWVLISPISPKTLQPGLRGGHRAPGLRGRRCDPGEPGLRGGHRKRAGKPQRKMLDVSPGNMGKTLGESVKNDGSSIKN